jgi:hypothetical protein
MTALTDEQNEQLEALKTAWIAATLKMRSTNDLEATWAPVNKLLDTVDRVTHTAYLQWAAGSPLKNFGRPCLPWPPE